MPAIQQADLSRRPGFSQRVAFRDGRHPVSLSMQDQERRGHARRDDFGVELVAYKRRIGSFLLWRAGPASRADTRYMAIDSRDLSRHYVFRLFPDGSGEGEGPDGTTHTRFRTWKESLRDA